MENSLLGGTVSLTNVDTTGQMMGGNGGFYFTPSSTGDVYITSLFAINYQTGGLTVGVRYGTGSAPSSGATTTGINSEIKLDIGHTSTTAQQNYRDPINLSGIIKGLSTSTQYWFDVYVANWTGANESPIINGPDFNIFELAGAIGATGATGATGSGSTYTYITEDTVNQTLLLAVTGSTTQTLALSNIVSTATDGTNVATNVLQNDGRITLSSTDGGAISTVFDMLPTGVVSTTSTDGTNTHEVLVEPAHLTLLGSDVRVDNLSANVGDFVAIDTNGKLVATASPSSPAGAAQGSFGITIDGGGSAITTGVKGYVEIPYDGTITGWTILGDVSGSCVIDVWKDTYANFPPTVADTIAGSEKPTLSSAIKNEDLTLTTWTTSVTTGDIIGFNVDSASTVTRVTLSIKITKL